MTNKTTTEQHMPTSANFGDTVRLPGVSGSIIVGADPSALDDLCTAREANDTRALVNLSVAGRIRFVMSGAEAKILETATSAHWKIPCVMVELSGGHNDGLRGWIVNVGTQPSAPTVSTEAT